MAIFALSDLHLAFSVDKPMDIFGSRWHHYMERIGDQWNQEVGAEDWVVVPGDISWATYLEEAVEDFRFIDRLPGKKIISKGNHDYWWTTMSKLEKFREAHGFSTLHFMHNNSFDLEGCVLCGTRGWKCPGDEDFGAEDRKIYERELQRLTLSLKSVSGQRGGNLLVSLHYPPFNARREPSEFVDIMQKFGVTTCIYGHLHGEGLKSGVTGEVQGIRFHLVSADHLGFKPLLLYP